MLSQTIDKNKFKAKIFKALSDPVRLDILDFLRDGEKCVCKIIPHVNLIQPVVSRHLRILRKSGLVKSRKDGNRRLYAITDHQIFNIIDDLSPELVDLFAQKMFEHIT
jgi:ArsR family transcriptional regulator